MGCVVKNWWKYTQMKVFGTHETAIEFLLFAIEPQVVLFAGLSILHQEISLHLVSWKLKHINIKQLQYFRVHVQLSAFKGRQTIANGIDDFDKVTRIDLLVKSKHSWNILLLVDFWVFRLEISDKRANHIQQYLVNYNLLDFHGLDSCLDLTKLWRDIHEPM